MPRDKEFESGADRQKAYRERKRNAEPPEGNVTRSKSVTNQVDQGYGTVTRYTLDGVPVEEPLGPSGLSLVAFPNQTPGSLKPSKEQLAKLGKTVGSRSDRSY